MSFSITALTPSGLQTVTTLSPVEAQTALTSVRSEGAKAVSVVKDGRLMNQVDLVNLTSVMVDKMA